MPRRSPALTLLLAALALAGCGQSQKEKYADDFKPLNDRLLLVGEQIGNGLGGAGDQTNAKLASQFAGFASDLEKVNDDIADLDPPKELRDESRALTQRTRTVVRDLRAISQAARAGDRKATTRATLAFGRNAQRLNQAQNRLARATGADAGSN